MSEATPSSEEDSIDRFAADLRKARLAAGNPTLARLQTDTGISRTVLSDAFAGRQLPSARTVDGIIRVCDGDVSAWIDRRDGLARSVAAAPERPAEAPSLGDEAAVPTRPTVTRRSAVLLTLSAFVVGAGISAVVAALIASSAYTELAAAPATTSPLITVANGEDPALTECVDDAEVATGDTRTDNSLIEIIWSNKCYAGWARITRYDGLYEGNTVTVAIYPETAPTGPDRQEATEHDVQGAYTTLVVRPTPDTLLCAEASYTVDGKRIDLGDPLCI